jgi:hypothetical protein
LKAHFFLRILAADISDIPPFIYPPEKVSSVTITIEEIESALLKAKPHIAPGPGSIPVFVLKLLVRPLYEYLQALLQACFAFSYHPSHFRHSSAVALRKPGKEDYSVPAAWQHIALLRTLGKVLEGVVARKITALFEEHGLLPPQHMGARPGRSTETALDLLLQQVYAAWQTGKGVASLISVDMTGAFDRVVPARLLHHVRKRKISEWIVSFISFFISDRSTSLILPGYSSTQFPTQNGIPQGSPLSPILFLFYNADLVAICIPDDLPASAISCVDDANPLAFGESTEETCESLEMLHKRCLKWSDMHGAEFAPTEYTLVHLVKQRSIPTTPLHLRNFVLHPSPSTRILGLIIDSKLSWRPHVAAIKEKSAHRHMPSPS